MLKCRTRILSFRVSEEEYLQIVRASSQSGAYSVSDWARDTIRQHTLAHNDDDLLARIVALERELHTVSELLQAQRSKLAASQCS
jgi:hypothetical protein